MCQVGGSLLEAVEVNSWEPSCVDCRQVTEQRTRDPFRLPNPLAIVRDADERGRSAFMLLMAIF